MKTGLWVLAAVVLAWCGVASAQQDERIFDTGTDQAAANEPANTGGVNIDLTISYFDDYIYRGLSRDNLLAGKIGPDLQTDLSLSFDLGKFPHPFVGIFVNVFNSDPISHFQEVRPYFGADWKIRPIIVSAGHTTYIYPNRDMLNTSEVWARITLMDDAIFNTDEPILSPYIYGAYDYDRYHGFYIEAGVKHDFVIENTGLTLTVLADVAWVTGLATFATAPDRDTGFQHYDVGLVGKYSLNNLLNIPRRLGRWTLNGYLYYTDGIEHDLRATQGLWGGGGIELSY